MYVRYDNSQHDLMYGCKNVNSGLLPRCSNCNCIPINVTAELIVVTTLGIGGKFEFKSLPACFFVVYIEQTRRIDPVLLDFWVTCLR